MGLFFLIFAILFILVSMLPFIQHQHWIFRVPEFLSLQLLYLHSFSIIGLLIFTERNIVFWIVLLIQIALLTYHLSVFYYYTKLYKIKNQENKNLQEIRIISTNIYQFNKDFDRFKQFIHREKPDIFITIESNRDWEKAMRELENDYPHAQKITLENTYGMHVYSQFPFEKVQSHFFVAEDVPSVEAHFKTQDGREFMLFVVHPPPPSPTEEANSKERDGDLLCIAKRIKKVNKPTLVIGDFNTVSWSKTARLFRKKSGLIDGRHGRGVLASFHAKYWFFRAPLDLVYHSESVFIKSLKVLEHVGSDHFPIGCVFGIDPDNPKQKEEIENISQEEIAETEVLIDRGIKEESDNR